MDDVHFIDPEGEVWLQVPDDLWTPLTYLGGRPLTPVPSHDIPFAILQGPNPWPDFTEAWTPIAL